MKQFKICFSFYFLFLLVLFSPKQSEIFKVLLCLFIHEIGHILAIILFKYKVNSLELSIFGFFMKLGKCKQEFYKDLILYSSGLIVNFIMLISISNTVFKSINLVMIIVNILPIYPLDGYNILSTLIYRIFPHYYSLIIVKIISIILLIFLSVYGILINVDLFIFLSLIYLVSINIITFCNIKILHYTFLLDRYLHRYKYKKRLVKFKEDFSLYFYKYNTINTQINRFLVEEDDILDMIFKNTF